MAVLNPLQQSPVAHVGLIYHIGNLGTMSVTALHDELNYLAFDEEEKSQKVNGLLSPWMLFPILYINSSFDSLIRFAFFF